MNTLISLLTRFFQLFVWWVVVEPWERALRVRLGSKTIELQPGFHWKIPYVDAIYRQSVRLRCSKLEVQTLTTSDGKTVTLSGNVSYCIEDVSKLYGSLAHAEDTIRLLTASAIAGFVSSTVSTECLPAKIEEAVSGKLEFGQYGLGKLRITLTSFAFVRTYRIINDSLWGTNGDQLNTTTPDAPALSRPSGIGIT